MGIWQVTKQQSDGSYGGTRWRMADQVAHFGAMEQHLHVASFGEAESRHKMMPLILTAKAKNVDHLCCRETRTQEVQRVNIGKGRTGFSVQMEPARGLNQPSPGPPVDVTLSLPCCSTMPRISCPSGDSKSSGVISHRMYAYRTSSPPPAPESKT